MEQKFLRGHWVKIADELPKSMSHFEAGCEAIVDHSYSDMYGKSEGIESYSLLLLIEDPQRVSWYGEDQLTLINSDRDTGEQILQTFKNV